MTPRLRRAKAPNELTSYFKETTVHGFRYLVDGRTLAERLAWMLVILSGFVYAGLLIYSNITDWEENPVITTIASTSTPVQDVHFPSVTVCPGEMFEFDRWGFLEELFNTVKFDCLMNVGHEIDDCAAETGAARNKFSRLLGGTFVNTVTAIQVVLDGVGVDELDRRLALRGKQNIFGGNHTEFLLLEKVAGLALTDPEASNDLRQQAINVVRTQLGMWKYYDDKGADNGLLSQVLIPLVLSDEDGLQDYEGSSLREMCRQNETCVEELINWHVFLTACHSVFARGWFGGLGTYLAHFAHLVGGSFREESTWPHYFEYRPNPLEDEYNRYFANLFDRAVGESAASMDTPVSLIDVPALLGLIRDEDKLIFAINMAYFLPWVYQSVYSTTMSDTCTEEELLKYGSAWLPFIAGKAKRHPCDDSHDKVSPSKCCHHWGKFFAGDKLAQVMTIMRFASPQGKPQQSTPSSPSTMPSLGQLLDLDAILGEDLPRWGANQSDPSFVLQMIPACWDPWHGERKPCDLFEPMLTSNGICYTYNARSAMQIFRRSTYTNIFQRVFGVPDESVVRKAVGDGEKFGLTFYLDGNTRTRPSFDFHLPQGLRRTNRMSTFTVGVQTGDSPFNMKRNILQVEPGRHTVIKVNPMQMTSTDDLRSLSIGQRNCKFGDEVHDTEARLSLLTNYSQAGCQFECMIRHSQSKCKCVPWNYPHHDDDGVEEICDMYGNLCFFEAMNELDRLQTCDCPSDCQTVYFTYSESGTILSPKQACAGGFVESYLYRKKRTSWYALRYESLMQQMNEAGEGQSGHLLKDQEELMKLCEASLEHDLAKVTVKLGSPILMTSLKSRKTTFAEQLATFGGTVGLFTGMSFLSAFEILFWLKRLALNALSGTKVGRK